MFLLREDQKRNTFRRFAWWQGGRNIVQSALTVADLVPRCACLGQCLCLLLLHCPPDSPSAALIPGQVGVFSSVARGPRFCRILIPLKWEATSHLLGFSPSWAPVHTQGFQSALASPTSHPSSLLNYSFKFQHPTEKPQPYRDCFVSSHKFRNRCPLIDPCNFPMVSFYVWTPTDTQSL